MYTHDYNSEITNSWGRAQKSAGGVQGQTTCLRAATWQGPLGGCSDVPVPERSALVKKRGLFSIGKRR